MTRSELKAQIRLIDILNAHKKEFSEFILSLQEKKKESSDAGEIRRLEKRINEVEGIILNIDNYRSAMSEEKMIHAVEVL